MKYFHRLIHPSLLALLSLSQSTNTPPAPHPLPANKRIFLRLGLVATGLLPTTVFVPPSTGSVDTAVESIFICPSPPLTFPLIRKRLSRGSLWERRERFTPDVSSHARGLWPGCASVLVVSCCYGDIEEPTKTCTCERFHVIPRRRLKTRKS